MKAGEAPSSFWPGVGVEHAEGEETTMQLEMGGSLFEVEDGTTGGVGRGEARILVSKEAAWALSGHSLTSMANSLILCLRALIFALKRATSVENCSC